MDDRAWDERYAVDEPVWTAEPNRFHVAEWRTAIDVVVRAVRSRRSD
jgi:hypothetical protein